MNKSQHIRSIFEDKMNESRKKLQGHMTPEARKKARDLEAGKGDAEHGHQLRTGDKRLSKNYPRLSTEVPYRDDQPASDKFHMTKGEAYDKKFNVVKREPKGARSSLLAHLARRGTSPKVKARAKELRNQDLEKQNSSTEHFRAGLKDLFEAVLLEKRGQSPLSKVFGDKMRKHVAKQRQRGKESIESSKKLVAKGVYSPEHTEDTAEIVRQGEKDLIKSARSGGRQILGKPPQHDSTDHVRAGLRALFESVIDEAKDPFGKPDPKDPKDLGIKPLPKAPKIKFKPKPAKMPKGPKAVVKPSQLFQRDPLDP